MNKIYYIIIGIIVLFVILLVYIFNNYKLLFGNTDLLNKFTVYEYNNKIRLGVNQDGGYVIADIPNVIYDCYLSCGVANEESFSRDFINKYKMTKDNSFAFDGSIDAYPTSYTENITFYKKYISNVNNENNTTMEDIIKNHNNIFMKMDIEGGEYHWFEYIDDSLLDRFSQMVIEIHNINSPENLTKINILMNKLNKYHYIVHVHGNNHSDVINMIPSVVEITFINKKYLPIQELNKQKLPIPNLDYPCDPNKPDIDLNFKPFVNI
jgi:hypothetical protein